MISARDVSKLYGRNVAVADVSIDVAAGDGIAVHGPRGCGTTTLLRLLGIWLEPSSGTIQICGFDARRQLWQARSRISYAASDALAGTALTVEEYLQFVTRARGQTAPSTRDALPIAAALTLAQLRSSARVERLAVADRAALAMAAVVAAPTDVMLIDRALDELDASPREAFSSWLVEAKSRGSAVIVATEEPDRDQPLFNRTLRVAAGKVIETTQRATDGAPE